MRDTFHIRMSLMYTLLVGTERREIGNLMNGVSTFVLMVYFLCRKASIGFFFASLLQKKMCDTVVVVWVTKRYGR